MLCLKLRMLICSNYRELRPLGNIYLILEILALSSQWKTVQIWPILNILFWVLYGSFLVPYCCFKARFIPIFNHSLFSFPHFGHFLCQLSISIKRISLKRFHFSFQFLSISCYFRQFFLKCKKHLGIWPVKRKIVIFHCALWGNLISMKWHRGAARLKIALSR